MIPAPGSGLREDGTHTRGVCFFFCSVKIPPGIRERALPGARKRFGQYVGICISGCRRPYLELTSRYGPGEGETLPQTRLLNISLTI